MQRIFFLTFLAQLLLLSAIKSQNTPTFVFINETLIENEQLNAIEQLIQTDVDSPPILNTIATIDRENRQISIEYKRTTESGESSGLYTFDEEGRPVAYVSYTTAGKQKNNERYTYRNDGSVISRFMWQDTEEDTPQTERWTRRETVSHYDENNNLIDFSTKGIQRGTPFSSEGKYTYTYDDEGRMTEKISLLQDRVSGEFVPLYRDDWEYSNNKVRHTNTQLKSGKKSVQISWYEEGLLVKEKRRSDNEDSTSQLSYEQGLLKEKHSSGDNELGSFDMKWVYEYK